MSMHLRFLRFSFPIGQARLRAWLAGFCLLLALACLCWGGGLFPPGFASARSPHASAQSGAQEHLGLKKQLLQATVDSAALSLAGILAGQTDPDVRRGLLMAALDALTFDLGAPVYFTAWEDTRLVHSPLTPDTENFDFGEALDGQGLNFVRILSAVSETDGGFLQVLLPRHVFDHKGSNRRTASGPSARTTGAVSPAFAATPLFPAESFPREEEDLRIVYSRLIPGSSWRISAFMSVSGDFAADPAPGLERAGLVWDVQERPKGPLPADLRLALCVSGFSLLGLAGVLLLPRP
ncbi:MAG: hypothetical protein LBJ82_03450 [Deltaproteobacteria bacterium]|jgi:hypothetical protein|nr:hypothetical protein [Deltaproteobacteria bacterium]